MIFRRRTGSRGRGRRDEQSKRGETPRRRGRRAGGSVASSAASCASRRVGGPKAGADPRNK